MTVLKIIGNEIWFEDQRVARFNRDLLPSFRRHVEQLFHGQVEHAGDIEEQQSVFDLLLELDLLDVVDPDDLAAAQRDFIVVPRHD